MARTDDLCGVGWGVGWAQPRHAVCDQGFGQFESSLSTGVTVRVGAVTSGGFAARACEAVLRWGNERAVVVPKSAQVDIDALGADLGLGVPVVAFVVRPMENDWRASYEIWSIERKPRLLRTLAGSDMYRAVDADFNRQVVIWTRDAAAVDGFDGLTYTDYSYPPTVVLQFERGKLVDVSAWYRAEYNRQIAELRNGLTAEALAEFRRSDGRLESGSVPLTEWLRLRKTKVAILEAVWAYLYSGRAKRAWAELDDEWPVGDVARVKAAIVAARTRGIEAQIDKVASGTPPPNGRKDQPFIYEYVKGVSSANPYLEADTAPQPISLWRPPPSAADEALVQREEKVRLIIDEAGKVQSAEMQEPKSDPKLLLAARGWKFIPALRSGKPVAFNLNLDVSPYK
jgi:hypothetical protein